MQVWKSSLVFLIMFSLVCTVLAQNNTSLVNPNVYYEEDNFFIYLIYGAILFVSLIIIGFIIKRFYKPSKAKSVIDEYRNELEEEEASYEEEPKEKTKEEVDYESSKEDFRKMWEEI